MNTHTLDSAVPPVNKAGPILLAGFTLVPVNGKPKICTNANVKPITIPLLEFSFFVTLSTTRTNTNVKIASMIKASNHLTSIVLTSALPVASKI